jgi:hypothetical protein
MSRSASSVPLSSRVPFTAVLCPGPARFPALVGLGLGPRLAGLRGRGLRALRLSLLHSALLKGGSVLPSRLAEGRSPNVDARWRPPHSGSRTSRGRLTSGDPTYPRLLARILKSRRGRSCASEDTNLAAQERKRSFRDDPGTAGCPGRARRRRVVGGGGSATGPAKSAAPGSVAGPPVIPRGIPYLRTTNLPERCSPPDPTL